MGATLTEATTQPATETVEKGPQGSGDGSNRSLTLPNAPQPAPKTALEEAFEAAQALEDAEKAKAEGEDKAGEEEVVATPTETATTDPEPTTDPDPNAVDPEATDEGVQVDEKGRAYIRPARLKKFLAMQADHQALTARLAQMALDTKGTKPEEATTTPKNPETEVQARITAAKEKLKTARADFDTEAESVALEELIDARADLKLAKSRVEDAAARQETGWESKVTDADKATEKQRDALWLEDQARLSTFKDPELDLGDESSVFYQSVLKQVNEWHATKHPIVLKPTCFRRAVELVADELGITLPAPKVAGAAPTTPAVPSVRSNTVTRRNAAVIAPTSPGGRPPVTVEQQIKALESLPPSKRLEALAQITEGRQKP